MPTENPRHTITEDEVVRAALDEAALRWPELRDRPSKLLRRLVAEGHRAIRESADGRRAAVIATSGIATGAYGPGHLGELRDEWPS
ncbi:MULTISPECIES: hypothetical protein [Actinokineospora]|uniref:Uncharacterized protein n=1 Tax=Actinokineospora fastidiosa TaxID=1816 RepID=A0A918G8Y7_9PSEU|nr:MULTISPECIES: hypothetical protein [Actinokineospora]UVS82200.1 hypothetical protein Actkin_05965 [Actinokineospora sp. UTMC 2448]GGS22933.1 hypothetical protein GCM10010171_14770 [Actinokineospora fastidiosa]